jgi:uncharacterized secreted protein with C-terminal beta-propeller domain
MKKLLFVFSSLLILFGCGNSDSAVDVIDELTEVPQLNPLSMSLNPLSKNTQTTFEQHIKNGIYLRSKDSTNNQVLELSSVPISASADSSNENLSNTNSQEVGVAEGDRIKYDGQYLFIANDQYALHTFTDGAISNDEQNRTSVRVIQRKSDGTIEAHADIIINNNKANDIDGLYLNNSRLAVLSSIYSYQEDLFTSNIVADQFFPMKEKFNLTIVDVNDPINTEVTTSFTADGYVINSRRVGNVLYIISSYTPTVDGLSYVESEEEELANYKLINDLTIEQLLPKYTDIDGIEHPLVSASNCYIPQSATDKDGFDGIVTLTAIDINHPENMVSACVNTQASGLYATPQSIYLYGTNYQYTNGQRSETSIIHKFSVDNLDINYQASGTLDGRFNWQMSNLRFSEQQNFLRVVTTSGDRNQGFKHRLNVLTQNGNELNLIAQLPNNINHKPIGKINGDGIVQEDIKAVRFYENNAYIVTFLVTDPLYVISLTDNTAPKIIGELEIPGYSAYLHPISDRLLLGIGQNVDANRLAPIIDFNDDGTVNANESSPIVEGAKISLFDISDLTNPQEISSLVYENSYTPVEYDYHALTYLRGETGEHRFSLPIERWGAIRFIEDGDQSYDVWSPENFLALIEVSSSDANATLIDKGKVKAENNSNDKYNYISGWNDRAVLHNNDIYYVHGNSVWRSDWQNPDQTTGPF